MNQIPNKTQEEINELLLEVEKSEISDFQYSIKVHTQISNIINNFEKFKSIDLSKNYMNFIILLNRLSFTNFCKIHAYIDQQYPGISFHYIMEARHEVMNYVVIHNYTRYNNNDVNNEEKQFIVNECEVYLSRLRLLQTNNMLGLVVAPMRARLITGLLTDMLESSNKFLTSPFDSKNNHPVILDENKFLNILKELEKSEQVDENREVYSTES